MNLDDARDMFIAESRDCLQVIEQQLLAMEQLLGGDQIGDGEALNQLFRAAHTIKGSAGLFALDAIVEFTHIVENVLDALRRAKLVADRPLITLLLNAKDYIGGLLDTLTAGAMPVLDAAARAMMVELSAHLAPQVLATPPAISQPVTVSPSTSASITPDEASSVSVVSNPCWHMSLRFYADILRDGMDPLAFLNYLSRRGSIRCLRVLTDDLPAVDDVDAELLYVGFEVDLESRSDADAIASTFEFVRDQSLIEILPPYASLDQYRRLTWVLPEPEQRLRELWVEQMQSLTQGEWDALQALSLVSTSAPASVIETANAADVEPARAEAVQTRADVGARDIAKAPTEARSGGRAREARFIKIDAGKLDQLIDLVGELVTSTAATQLQAQRLADSANTETVATVMNLVEQVRDSALSLRMVAMSEVFNRFPRVVRDVAQELGKEIELKIDGADTELDKSMVEKLTDPLTHIVRNAIDHGIESVDVRIAAGKPRHGTVWMSARHDAGGIVIEVSDDGGGLKRDRILAKAIEKQLISADAQLADSEVWQLLFLPGFSTAEAVTNLSGRGVGMDVVKRNIESQHGSVEFDSEPGAGTRLRIRLPLTLAIIDGFQFAVGPHRFVVPLDAVIECFELTALTQDVDGANCVNLRGEVLPLVRIAKLYELNDCQRDAHAARQNVVVVQAGQRRAGLVVDTLQGELQAVIKPLSRLFRGLRGVGGSTVLGSGDVALILDVAQLIGLAQSISQRAFVGYQ